MIRVRIVDREEAFVKVLILAGIPRQGEIVCLRRRNTTSGEWGNWHYRVDDVVYLEDGREAGTEGGSTCYCYVDVYVSRALYGVWQDDDE